jgi:hypothetical protein
VIADMMFYSTAPDHPFIIFSIVSAAVILFCWLGARKRRKRLSQLEAENASLRVNIPEANNVIAKTIGIPLKPDISQVTSQAIIEILAAQRNALIEKTRDNFAYIMAIDEHKIAAGPIRLQMDASGPVFAVSYWISNASAKLNRHDAAYWSVDRRKPLVAVINPGAKNIDWLLPTGDYVVEFHGLNGSWCETLSIYFEDGRLKQKIRVTTASGELLFASETS